MVSDKRFVLMTVGFCGALMVLVGSPNLLAAPLMSTPTVPAPPASPPPAQGVMSGPSPNVPAGAATPAEPAPPSGDSDLQVLDVPQSSSLWHYPHTPFKTRFGIVVGDQAGGPVRYNTHFPDVRSDPHPASYFHSLVSIGGEFEYAFKRGGLLLGALVRRDVWHRSMKRRSIIRENETWTVEDFAVSDNGLLFGWVFGERYREVPWAADLALVYDRGSVDLTLGRSDGSTALGQVNIEVLSLRSRFQFGWTSSQAFSFSLGPEIHLPIVQKPSDRSDAVLQEWVKTNLELKGAAALGVSMMASYRI